MKSQEDNSISLKDHFDYRFKELFGKIENLEKNFVSQMQMRNSLDELIADWTKKEEILRTKIVCLDSDFRPFIEDLSMRKKDRRNLNMLVIGTFLTSAISFFFTIIAPIINRIIGV